MKAEEMERYDRQTRAALADIAGERSSGNPEGALLLDEYGLPFVPLDEFSDDPLEFEEVAGAIKELLDDIHLTAASVNKLSPFYLTACEHLERCIKQMGSFCVTKAVLEQEDCQFPSLEGVSIRQLYAMVSLHFRKCRGAFRELHENQKILDMQLMDWICRWALLAERLKATEEKIRQIQSGKINAEKLVKTARLFHGERSGTKHSPQQKTEALRKAASLPISKSYIRELVVQKKREEARRKAEAKGPYHGYREAPIYPPIPFPEPDDPETDFSQLTNELQIRRQGNSDNSQKQTGMIQKKSEIIQKNTRPNQLRAGPSEETRRKLREKRKKRK